EQFLKYLTDPVKSLGIAADEAGELLEAELPEKHEETVEDSPYTDDPVRVYLREMGSVKLLTRQGEVDLAQRMERGKLRSHKALSRSPLVLRRVFAIHEQARRAEIRLEDVVEVKVQDDEAAAKRARAEVNRRFTRFAKTYQELLELE